MSKSGLWLVLLAASMTGVSAQVTAELQMPQDQFLVGESLPVTVRITNRSGQPLALGGEDDWLTFSIESRDGFVVPKNSDAPVKGEFRLDSSKTAIKRVDVAPFFALTAAGRYEVIANVKIKNWDRQINSSPVSFNLIQGAKLWEQDFGVPPTPGQTNSAPEVRKYLLQQATYSRGKLRLYVRITDETGTRTLRVLSLGGLASFNRLEPQMDRFSNLHVLFPEGARTYGYSVVSPDGDLITRQSFEYVDTRPRLVASDQGVISVTGGVRRLTSSDVPAPATPPSLDEVPKSKP